MTLYLQGETAIIAAQITDASGNLFNPDTITCVIKDPSGNIDSSGNMILDASGNYHYDYNLPDDADVGAWKAIVEIVVSLRTVKEHVDFTVDAE